MSFKKTPWGFDNFITLLRYGHTYSSYIFLLIYSLIAMNTSIKDNKILLQIRTYWMPLLRRVLPEEHRRPVILVGNRSDMLEVSSMEVRPIVSFLYVYQYCRQLFGYLKIIKYIMLASKNPLSGC